MPKFSTVALDLDGTALNSAHCLADETIAKIRELSSRGVRILLATGRSTPAVYDHVLRLNLSVPLHCVLFNGAYGCVFKPNPTNPVDEIKDIFRIRLGAAEAKKVIDFGAARGNCVQYYVRDRIYVHASSPGHASLMQRYTDLTSAVHTFCSSPGLKEAIADSPTPEKILVMCEQSEVEEIAEGLTQLCESLEGVQYIIKGGFFVEVLGACKGTGLEKMAATLGISMGEIVAFGDGFNDLEFILGVGRGVAMKNGRQIIKDAADRTTDYTNEELGVVRELERMEEMSEL